MKIDYKNKMKIGIHERFWAKVNKTKTCWLWTGYKTSYGYGRFGMAKHVGVKPAHRVSWMLTHGEVPDDLFVLHKCDVPACVRPDHLFLGTASDNSQDMKRKRHSTYGENNTRAKLTNSIVLKIRELYSQKEFNQYQLADMYNVSVGNISMIINRIHWTHI